MICAFPRGTFFVPMEVYADESGIHGGSRRCVLAGYSGGRRKQQALESDWRKALSDFSVPEDVGFHAKTFFKNGPAGQRFGVYQGCIDDKATAFIDRLIAATNNNALHPIGGGVYMEYWNSLSHNLRRWLTGGIYDEPSGKWLTSGAPNKPWFFAFQEVIIGGASFAKGGVKVDFIFDRQDNFSGLALNMFSQMRDEQRWRTGQHLGGIAFYSRFERVCLQAADLLAFCLFHLEAYRKDTDKPEIAYALHHLADREMNAKSLDRRAVELLLPQYPQSLKEQDEEKQRIREFRQHNAQANEGVARGPESETGRGESSKKAEA